MTDTMTYSGPPAVADMEPMDDQNADQRRKLLLLGGLAAALVLGLLAYFLFFTGGESTEEQVVTPAKSQAAAPPAPAEEAPVAEEASDAPRRNQPGRNPFKALVVEPVEAPAAAVAPVAGTLPATGTTVPGTTTPELTSSYRFRVVDVAPDNSTITVKVNGELYRNLTAGEVFAGVFKVRLVSGQVNSFQFGEEIFNVNGSEAITLA